MTADPLRFLARDLSVLLVAALLLLIPATALGFWGGGAQGAWSAFFGVAGAAAVQVGATFLVLRQRLAGGAEFLGAFALAALFRVVIGALVVIVALKRGVPSPPIFVAAFAAAYAVVEVVADVRFVRRERLSGPAAGRAE